MALGQTVTHTSSDLPAQIGVVSIWLGLMALVAMGLYVVTFLNLPKQGTAVLATLWVMAVAAIGNGVDKWWRKREAADDERNPKDNR